MKWYYVDNGQQAGPVDESQLTDLIASGKLRGDTLVWHEGLGAWQAFSAVCPPQFAATFGVPPLSPGAASGETTEAVCAECNKIFRKDEMIRHKDVFVCANCKPVFLQRIREGLGPTSFASVGGATETQVRERDYEHDLGTYFSQSWQLFKSDPGLIIGVSFVVGLCLFLANVVPYLSLITGLILTGPLMGGLFGFFLKKARGHGVVFGDGFGGFGPRFGQLLLGNVVPGLLAGLCMIPVVIVVAVVVALVLPAARNGGSLGVGSIVAIGVGGLFFLAALCVAIYLQVCWNFTLWLALDKGLSFWPAMALSRAVVRKHWWQNLLLILVCGLLNLVGALFCGVGLLVTGPVSIGVLAYAYQRLFGDMQSA